MFKTLYPIYFVLYIVFTLPFEKNISVFLIGMALPGILYGGWRMFETLQKEGNFSVYYKVMGRWYFQIWSYIVLPCAVIANMDDSLLFAALGTMILLPTIIWFWMFFWMLGMTGKETWVSEHELNWEEPLRPNDDE